MPFKFAPGRDEFSGIQVMSDRLLVPRNTFDALVCWMVGADPGLIGMRLAKNYMEFSGSEMATYRTLIQARCYELGKYCLKPGGFVHITDRGALRSWNDKTEMRHLLAKKQCELAGLNYQITPDATLFKKAGNFKTSGIQYIASFEATKVNTPILLSSKAVLLQ